MLINKLLLNIKKNLYQMDWKNKYGKNTLMKMKENVYVAILRQ